MRCGARRRFPMVFQGLCWLNLRLIVGVAALGFTTLGVGVPTSYSMESRQSLDSNVESFGGIATISVAMHGVGLVALFPVAPGS